MAGLVPAIHVLVSFQDVDARHKAGHDGLESDASFLMVRRRAPRRLEP